MLSACRIKKICFTYANVDKIAFLCVYNENRDDDSGRAVWGMNHFRSLEH
jgi:hypothetical protein